MTSLQYVSKICATILPFFAAIYQLMMAFDNRKHPWKLAGCLACSALFLFVGWVKLG